MAECMNDSCSSPADSGFRCTASMDSSARSHSDASCSRDDAMVDAVLLPLVLADRNRKMTFGAGWLALR